MAEWDTWDSCVGDSKHSNWDADIVLSTGSTARGEDSNSSHARKNNYNNKPGFEKKNNTNNNWKDKQRSNEGRRNETAYNHSQEMSKPRDRLRNWKDDNNLNDRSRNYPEDKSDRKYNYSAQQNVYRDRPPHESRNKNRISKPSSNEYFSPARNRSKSHNQGSTTYDSRPDHKFENRKADFTNRNTGSARNPNNASYTNMDERSTLRNQNMHPLMQNSNKSVNNRRRDSDDLPKSDFYEAREFATKRNDFGGKRNNANSRDEKNDRSENNFQQVYEPPQLLLADEKQAVNLEDIRSSKFSVSKSESVTSSDQHETEMKILNMIHDFKTTLHLIEIKPSPHVQKEIKGLQKYINLIFDKWNPKSRKDNASSESETSDSYSSDKETKKRNKRNRNKKQKEQKQQQNKNNEESESKGERNKVGNQEPDNNVSQFHENTANFLNHPSMGMPVNAVFRPPFVPMYQPMPLIHPPPLMTLSGNLPPFSHMQQNSFPPFNDSANTEERPPKTYLKNPTNPPKSQNTTPASNILSNACPKDNLSPDALSIVDGIRVSGVTMSKAHIKQIRAALDKISLVDAVNLTSSELNEDFKNINACMLKVVENENLTYDIKNAILNLLEDLFKNTCEEKTHSEVQKLISIYRHALEEMKTNNIDYNANRDRGFEQFQALCSDTSNVNRLLEFKESTRELMTSHTEAAVVTADTSASESENESEGDSSEDENENQTSDEENEVKENKNKVSKDDGKTKKKKKSKVILKEELSPHCKSFLKSGQSIEEQVAHLLATYTKVQSPESKTEERRLLYLIKDLVKKMYPNCILHLFGSRVSNMALPDSDMDIYIDITGKGYNNSTAYEDQQIFVKKIRKLFYQRSDCFSHILGLTKTKVPIIKLQHKTSAINCDISFKNGISVENTMLLNYYLSIDHRVKWLVGALKLWAHYNHLYASDYFTSHALSWLVLFYLMQEKIVPPIILLKKNASPRIIDHWDIAYKKLSDWTPASEPSSVVFLFQDFFRFLIEVNVTSNVLCTHTGDVISKETFADLDLLEQYKGGVFKEYVGRIRMNQSTDLLSKENPSATPMLVLPDQLCIQDPFEFSKNISTPVKQRKFEHFNTLCCLTLEQLLA